MASPLESHYYWRCGRCHTWNDAGRSTCKRCGASDMNHDAVQKEDKLDRRVMGYYHNTAPEMLKAQKNIVALLGEILEEIKNAKGNCN